MLVWYVNYYYVKLVYFNCKPVTYIHTYRRSGNFHCKNIFVVCANHEKKKKKKKIYIYIFFFLQRIIIIARTFLLAHFTAQLASYFAQDSLFNSSMSLELMPNAKQLFAQCREIVCLYCHSACLWRYWVPFCTLVVHQQLHGIATNAACKLCITLSVRSFVPDH